MRIILTFLIFLVAFDVKSQALWRNFFTTNHAPVVEVVAGSNATVQATTPNVFTRRFTVNAIPGGTGSGQTNDVVVIPGTNTVVVTNNPAAGVTSYTVSAVPTPVYGSNVIGAVNESSHATNADVAITAGTATFVLTSTLTNHIYGTNVEGAVSESVHATNADSATTATFVTTGTLTNKVSGSNVIGSVVEATHATNADNATSATTATTSAFVSTAILTNQTYASNVVSGGQIVNGGVETNQLDTGFLQLTGDKRKTTINGSVLTNLTGANVVGAVAEATHATNADNATTATSATTATKATYVDFVITNKIPQAAITNQTPRVVGITIDGGGVAITTGFKGVLLVPYACTIVAADMMADQYGGCGINVYRTNGFNPIASSWTTTAQKISGAATPVITQTNWSTDTTLTGWTTAIVANDYIGFNVESNASITKLTLQLKLQP